MLIPSYEPYDRSLKTKIKVFLRPYTKGDIIFTTVLVLICLSLTIVTIYAFAPRENPKQIKLKEAKAIVLTCMDFRLVDDIVYKLNGLGYLNNYNNFVLAGASLGYNGIPKTTNWAQTFEEHVDIAKSFHKIEEIIIIDHLQCKAYTEVYKEDELKGDLEREKHVLNLRLAKETLNKQYPTLKLLMFIIDIEGEKLEKIE